MHLSEPENGRRGIGIGIPPWTRGEPRLPLRRGVNRGGGGGGAAR